MVRAMSGRSMVLLAPVCAEDEDTLFAVVGVHVGAGPHHGGRGTFCAVLHLCAIWMRTGCLLWWPCHDG
jgi:hypothetical protein